MSRIFAALVLILALGASALAVNPDEILPDPVLEQRARTISAQLRCLVCQNQSIDDSNAQLAKDLRIIVRERLVAGDSDAQTINFIVARYGEFVLLRPVFAWHTLALWIAAPLALLIGLIIAWRQVRLRRNETPTELTPAEKKKIAALLQRDE